MRLGKSVSGAVLHQIENLSGVLFVDTMRFGARDELRPLRLHDLHLFFDFLSDLSLFPRVSAFSRTRIYPPGLFRDSDFPHPFSRDHCSSGNRDALAGAHGEFCQTRENCPGYFSTLAVCFRNGRRDLSYAL